MNIAIDSRLPEGVREVLRYAISTLSDIIPCDGTSIMLRENDTLVIRLYALSDLSQDVEKKLEISLKMGERIAGRAAEICETIVITGDVNKDKRFPGIEKYQELLSGLSTPIMKGESCVGILNLKRIATGKVLTDAEIEIIEKFAANLGEFL